MSHSTKQNQSLKIEALAGIKSDIILLSDLRLGNNNANTAKGNLYKSFLINSNNSYIFIANSTQNGRGVGVLIKKELGINIITSITDPKENYLILLVELNEKRAIIASIYGPNVHDPYFFQNLYRDLKSLGEFPLVMGGDFNATFSNDPIDVNIDCMAMIDIPNYRHSKYIGEFCEALNLTLILTAS
jgi:exonuclease III